MKLYRVTVSVDGIQLGSPTYLSDSDADQNYMKVVVKGGYPNDRIVKRIETFDLINTELI